MAVPLRPARLAWRPASRTIAAACITSLAIAILAGLAILEGGRVWQVQQDGATSSLKPRGRVYDAAVVGRCYLHGPDTATWPDWIRQGLRAHRDDGAPPGTTNQATAPVGGNRVRG